VRHPNDWTEATLPDAETACQSRLIAGLWRDAPPPHLTPSHARHLARPRPHDLARVWTFNPTETLESFWVWGCSERDEWLIPAISGLIRRGEATGNLRAPLPFTTSLRARRGRARFRQRAPKRRATGFSPCGYGRGCVCAIPAWLLAMAASMPYWCQGPQERARTSFALDLARSPTAALAPERLVAIDAAPSRVAS
jgi:hypothetical protein